METVEAEIISDDIVSLKQEPIILYDLVQAKGAEVQKRINSLNIENIEATNENLQLTKRLRAELSHEFRELEDKRKLIKDLVIKPYNDFEASYKEHIQKPFKNADGLLKEKISAVEDEILKLKIEGIRAYFDEINTFEWVKFEDLELKIIKSISDKKIKEEVEEKLLYVQQDLSTIDTVPNKDRVLAKYQITKDLNRAISEVNIEIQREETIKKQKDERERRQREFEDRQALDAEESFEPKQEPTPVPLPPKEKPKQEDHPKMYKTSFKITATLENIKALKNFMNERGISYESVK